MQQIQSRGCEETVKSDLQLLPWPNPAPDRDYLIDIEGSEVTCLCPLSKHPDFVTIWITYAPGQATVELQSLKFYFESYRDQVISHEELVNRILDDLVVMVLPKWIRVVGDFHVRGGLKVWVAAEHSIPEYIGPRPEYRRSY